MNAPDGGFDPARMLTALNEAGVRYVLIGGMAAILHGDAGVTVDMDVVSANREKIAWACPACAD